jgi:hypothetical protein
MTVASLLFVVGTVSQYGLRRRRARVTMALDASLAVLAIAALVYAGVSVHYTGAPAVSVLQ